MKINLDIAGMYYSRHAITVPVGSTVKDVMLEAVRLDTTSPNRRLSFTGETSPNGQEYLSSIEIAHLVPAESRQLSGRLYPVGRYVGRDTPVSFVQSSVTGSSPVISADDGSLRSVLAWQYYVYDKNFVDKNRRAGKSSAKDKASMGRSIIPYNTADEQNALEEGDTIVWRLVVIFIKPTFPLDMPVAIMAA